MKLFNFKKAPVETGPPGNDGSKLPIPGFLSPGGGLVIEEGEVPSLIPGSSDDDPVKQAEDLILDQASGMNRIDLSRYRVPVNRPVKFELGDPIVIEGCKFKIVYIRSNPSRMTLEAV